tara:strand:+ start:62 stop:583 length:522 start_codon:yes stop_codon:yes gene_type:complete
MKFSLKPNYAKKELKYYLDQYQSAVKRHSYWRNHPVSSQQTAVMRERTSESAKVHLGSAITKYLVQVNFTEKSLKARDARLKNLINLFVQTFQKNGLGVKIRGNRADLLSKVLYQTIKNGSFQDLRHNHMQKTPEEMEIEVEYRDLISHYFRHPGIAKDTAKIIDIEFDKVGQ